MKKAVIPLIIVLLLISTSFGSMTSAVKMNTPTSLTITSLTYTFLFTEPTFSSIQVASSKYTKIDMQGCVALGEQPGTPTLPVKFVKLMLPPKTTVDSILVTGTPVAIQLSGVNLVAKPIFPYQNEVPLGSPMPQQLVVNKDLYASSNAYPPENHGQFSTGYSHGYAIMEFSLNPMQYAPATGELSYYPTMTVTINLHYTGEVNQFFRNSPKDEQYVQSLVSNPEMTTLYQGLPITHYPRNGLCNPLDHYDYVIVTTTQNGLDHWTTGGTLTYNWTSLMQEHEGDGLSCTEVTIEDINANPAFWNDSYYPLFNDTPAHLREFCKDAYQNWGTQYVLIAGDCDPIPSRLMDYAYESDVDADIYFSNLDNNFNANHNSEWGEEGDSGFDPYAELYIGRIPCEQPQDVSNWLTKSLYYANSSEPEYLDNAAFYAGDCGWNGSQGSVDLLDFGAIKTTTNWLGPDPDIDGPYPIWLGMQYGFETWNATNPDNTYNLTAKWVAGSTNESGWQGGNQNAAITGLRNDINNNKVTLLCCDAHADQHMSCDVFDTDWASLYHNTQPFFIMDMGCHCGDFDAGNGVLDTMLFNSPTYLAFACTYNTGYSWGFYGTTNCSSALQMKSFWDYFFDVQNDSGSQANWQFGKGQAFSKDTMAPTLNWTDPEDSWRGTIECNTFFGDPAQTLKTPHPSSPPWKPSIPVGPTLGICHVEYTYTTNTTTDPDGDPVFYLFDWGDGTNSGWLPTGMGNHSWNEPGTYDVKVKALDIWGASSLWSDPLTVVIVNDTAPSIPTITGPSNGRPGKPYLFNFKSDDAEGQNIWFFIEWGDGSNSSWLGPYVSGMTIQVVHTWDTQGTYIIKAKAKDTYNLESAWGTLQVTMPLSYEPPHFRFFEWLFERFPNAFPILRYLFGFNQ